MDERLRGKGYYSIEEIMAYTSVKEDLLTLEAKLNEDYALEKVIIENSKTEGWGINYRAGSKSLCYIHPEKNGIFIAFQITEAAIEKVRSKLSDYALEVWEKRYPCGNGGWMWYRLTQSSQVDEVRLLLNHKIKPSQIK